jgi:hypothetical protein
LRESGKSGEGELSAGSWAGEDEFAQAKALLFHAIKKALRPYKFGGKNSEGKGDHQPSRSRRYKHDDPQGEQGEPEEDLEESFGLCPHV